MLFVSFNIILTSKLNIMNKQKQLPNVKLQKTSVIFMQLGLILALFIVYQIIEHESFYKPYAYNEPSTTIVVEKPIITDFIIEKDKPKPKRLDKKVNKVILKQEPKPAETFETVADTNKKIEEAVLTPTDPDEKDIVEPRITVNDIDEVDPDEESDVEIIFSKVEFAPEYPGCKGSSEEKRKCFGDKVRQIVSRNFNTELAQELGLNSGKKRINVQFVIDTNGNIIDIQARGTHNRLEKEAKRVIKLLPKMKPARQGNGHPKVRFSLPILFMVEN